MSAPIPEQLLSPQVGDMVELYTIDTTKISPTAAVIRVSPNSNVIVPGFNTLSQANRNGGQGTLAISKGDGPKFTPGISIAQVPCRDASPAPFGQATTVGIRTEGDAFIIISNASSANFTVGASVHVPVVNGGFHSPTITNTVVSGSNFYVYFAGNNIPAGSGGVGVNSLATTGTTLYESQISAVSTSNPSYDLLYINIALPAGTDPVVFSGFPIARKSSASLTRGGNQFYGAPIEGEGFERGGSGAMAQPTVRVSNVERLLSPWVWGAQDMIGAEVWRTVVLKNWLDGEPGADPAAFITHDRYVIEQKTRHDREQIEWKLRAAVDRSDQRLPGRLALPTCQLRYRVWTGSAFDYSQATCPYVGASMWDYRDISTATHSEDLCSKELTGCKNRFPAVALPTTAFPGLK